MARSDRDPFSERYDYAHTSLGDDEVGSDPWLVLLAWLRDAADHPEIVEPTAVALATATPTGVPSLRFVLARAVDAEQGIVRIFTNYTSRKGQEIAQNPHVALTWWWPQLERQVRLTGTARPSAAADSDAYFASRPRGSQLGAVASPQSQPIAHREVVEDAADHAQQTWRGRDVARPNTWGGYDIAITAFEFWQGRPSRLHDRIEFVQRPVETEEYDDSMFHLEHDAQQRPWWRVRLAP